MSSSSGADAVVKDDDHLDDNDAIIPAAATAPLGLTPSLPGRRSRLLVARRRVSRFGVPIFLVFMFVGFSLGQPSEFFTQGNVDAMISSQSAALLLALAITLMLRSGGIDFSLAYNMIVSASVVAVLTTSDHFSVVLAVAIALAVSMLIGAVNAVLCVRFGLNTFIVTLGMGTILTGIAYLVTNNNVIVGLPNSLTHFSRAETFNLPAAAGYGLIVAILLWIVLEWTPFGRDLTVIGGNRLAAEHARLKVAKYKSICFIVAAAIAGFTGIVLAGSQGSVDPTSAQSYLLGPITASFLGATAIQMGRFNVVGTVIALYLVTVAETGLTLLGVAPWVSQVFNGGALVGAMIFARLTTAAREGHAAGSRFTQG